MLETLGMYFLNKKKITNFLCFSEIRLIRNVTSSEYLPRGLERKSSCCFVRALIGLSSVDSGSCDHSGPIRDQYPGHVITLDKSETSIYVGKCGRGLTLDVLRSSLAAGAGGWPLGALVMTWS